MTVVKVPSQLLPGVKVDLGEATGPNTQLPHGLVWDSQLKNFVD